MIREAICRYSRILITVLHTKSAILFVLRGLPMLYFKAVDIYCEWLDVQKPDICVGTFGFHPSRK